jgi:hypothetical protein
VRRKKQAKKIYLFIKYNKKLVFVRIHMGMVSSYPMFDSKSFVDSLREFRKILFKIWKSSISFWLKINNRENNFIRLSISEKLLVYLRTSANICFFNTFREKILFKIFHRRKHCYSFMGKIPLVLIQYFLDQGELVR